MWLLYALSGCDRSEDEVQDAGRLAVRQLGWVSGTLGGLKTDLYSPSLVPEGGSPLFIVLHGCSQTPADLKSRAELERAADAFGAVVALPLVANGGRYLGCWDYYGSVHSRTSGDSGDLLDLVEDVLAAPDLEVDPDKVWIAGLSSGGGMAMVMGCLAPDVFSGVGIAAGPTVGTTAFQISRVSTDLTKGSKTCGDLAGTHEAAFDTQLAGVVSGTSDYTVAQGYAGLNAQIFAGLHGAAATSPLDVTALEGNNPQGTGTVWSDDDGPRTFVLSVTGMGHAWPAGTGTGYELKFVAEKGPDFAWALAEFFATNARRAAPIDVPTEPTEPEPTETEPPPEDPEPADPEPTEPPPEDPGDCWVSEVDDDINGHLPRYGVYSLGYGVADETYVNLFSEHGLSELFPLYQAADGDWYADPALVPCP